MAVVAGLVCLIVGFVVGTRARQMAAALKAVGSLLKRVPFSLKDPKKMEEEGKAEEVAPEGEAEADADEISMEDFLDVKAGLDVHPDLCVSPIFMYKVKQAKEETKRQAALQALLEQGVSEENATEVSSMALMPIVLALRSCFAPCCAVCLLHLSPSIAYTSVHMSQLVEMQQNMGGGTAGALLTLIQAGARVLPVSSNQSSEQQQLNEIRRKKKNIDVFLSKSLGVDISMEKVDKSASRRLSTSGSSLTAEMKAIETASRPIGGASLMRSEVSSRLAWHSITGAPVCAQIQRSCSHELTKLAPCLDCR
jgi:hypothetical protein